MKFTNIISVSNLRTINVWKYASRNIIKYIQSDNYTVIVPKSEIKKFIKISPNVYSVLSEESFIQDFNNYILKKNIIINNFSQLRLKWYFQQFIKLAALEKMKNEDIFLLWDADTVPLRNLNFFYEDKLLFYKSGEYTKTYFEFIEIFLGLKKNNNFSFIAQCFSCKGKWSKSFFLTIEKKWKKNWKHALIDNINFNEFCGFSEYETLGAFIYSKYKREIKVLDNKWMRFGRKLIASENNLKYFSFFFKRYYDFISFEHWDEFFLFSQIKRMLKKFKRN
jgi:hypothetical protein